MDRRAVPQIPYAKRLANKQRRSRLAKGDDCFICSSAVGTNPAMIHVVDGGANILRPGAAFDPNHPGEMGLKPIGQGCVKRFSLKNWIVT